MPFFMQCPFCEKKFDLSFTEMVTGCPHCSKTLLVNHLDERFSWEPFPSAAPAGGSTGARDRESGEHVLRAPRSCALAPPVETNQVNKAAGPAVDLPEREPSFVQASAPPAAIAGNGRARERESAENALPDWLSPWGFTAFGLGVLALLLAGLVGVCIL